MTMPKPVQSCSDPEVIGLMDRGLLQPRTPLFNDWFPQSNQLRAMPWDNPYNHSCEALKPVHEIGGTPNFVLAYT
jgi:hypothetical protein